MLLASVMAGQCRLLTVGPLALQRRAADRHQVHQVGVPAAGATGCGAGCGRVGAAAAQAPAVLRPAGRQERGFCRQVRQPPVQLPGVGVGGLEAAVCAARAGLGFMV
jgi:hypothetical protein